mmetsp:Transcript_8821/g.19086  ORF Transcript_8821/g.19086 Transcript_8821/m.19086 type:complete len:206 (-) Transcript_8821:126-743(-)
MRGTCRWVGLTATLPSTSMPFGRVVKRPCIRVAKVPLLIIMMLLLLLLWGATIGRIVTLMFQRNLSISVSFCPRSFGPVSNRFPRREKIPDLPKCRLHRRRWTMAVLLAELLLQLPPQMLVVMSMVKHTTRQSRWRQPVEPSSCSIPSLCPIRSFKSRGTGSGSRRRDGSTKILNLVFRCNFCCSSRKMNDYQSHHIIILQQNVS